MSGGQAAVTVLVMAIGTLLTRALPFLMFPAGRPTPRFVRYLGRVLPCATIGMLVVYCLREMSPWRWPHGLPELIAVALVVAVQLWRHNILLSISTGTVLYMALVQFVFV